MDETKTTYFRVRSFFRGRVLDTLGFFAKPQPGIHILNGHRVQNEAEPDKFRKLLKDLSQSVTFINIQNAVEMISNHENPDKPFVAFTFDDGFMDGYHYFAPILEEFGVNALFFVNPNYVEGDERYIYNFNENTVLTPDKLPMRWKQLKELADRGHIIGAHTMDHYMINSDDDEVLRYQIISCKAHIEKNIGKPCDYFAFPFGRLSQANQKSIDIACNTYKYVFSQSDYKHYYSFDGKVINRRHFEPFWPTNHVKYFLSCNKSY